MKKLLGLLLLLVFAGCEKTLDCVKAAGDTTVRDYAGLSFDTVLVRRGIAVVVSEGPQYQVRVQTGANLIDDISVSVQNNVLVLEDRTSCNWTRDFGQTVVYVTAPSLKKIISKTQCDIASNGTLHYPELSLRSMDSYDAELGTGTGNFYFKLENSGSLFIESNTVSTFVLAGKTTNARYKIYEGSTALQAQGMVADTVDVYHRGSSDVYLRATKALRGDLYNIGNVYAFGQPGIVSVTPHYRGQLVLF